MSKDLAELTAAEEAAIKVYEELMAAKEKEGKALLDDKKFLVDLSKNCALKTKEHEENMKMRSEELLALADTIKILNDDDALELFKKTLPGASASFVQLQVKALDQRQQALAVIHAARRGGRPELNFLALALQGKKVDFSKVVKMIDEMVVVLKAQQQDDNDKKEYCETQFDLADDKKKGLERSVSDLTKSIEKG